jgi:hypothetical protein
VTEPNQDPAAGQPSPDGLGPLTPPPPVPYEGQHYPPPSGFPPPPGTQYGNVQYGGQYGGGPHGSGPYGSAPYNSAPYSGGPYNAGPYGYPQGYYGQQQGTSGLAIASLILGICGFLCVTPFVGLGLGIGALTKISKTGQPGKGMAIAGIILSGLWIALLVLMIATGHVHWGTDSGTSGGSNQGSDGTSA